MFDFHRFRWARQDSNLRPTGYEPAALTAELRALYWQKPSKKSLEVCRAGNGTRTRDNSLEGWCVTATLCPRVNLPESYPKVSILTIAFSRATDQSATLRYNPR
jgi:hypothetical protein